MSHHLGHYRCDPAGRARDTGVHTHAGTGRRVMRMRGENGWGGAAR